MGRFRFFFYSNEGREPPHIHVKSAENEAKFWLDPIQLEWNDAFNGRELTTIEAILEEYQEDLLEAWNEYFA
jgi:hypothetical protein